MLDAGAFFIATSLRARRSFTKHPAATHAPPPRCTAATASGRRPTQWIAAPDSRHRPRHTDHCCHYCYYRHLMPAAALGADHRQLALQDGRRGRRAHGQARARPAVQDRHAGNDARRTSRRSHATQASISGAEPARFARSRLARLRTSSVVLPTEQSRTSPCDRMQRLTLMALPKDRSGAASFGRQTSSRIEPLSFPTTLPQAGEGERRGAICDLSPLGGTNARMTLPDHAGRQHQRES